MDTTTNYEFINTSPWVNRIAKLPFPLGTLIFLLTSKVAREVFKRIVVDRSTDTALHPIYDYDVNGSGYSVWDHRWQSSRAAQSLRFRFNWINDRLYDLLGQPTPNRHGRIQVVSLGSGTGRAFVETLKKIDLKDMPIMVNFVDIDERAITRAYKLAHKSELLKHINFINATSTDALDRFGDGNVYLVEMVGIAEYVDDKWLKNEFRKISSVLQTGGYFIGAAISSDQQSDFSHRVLRWPTMTYRSEAKLSKLFDSAGFRSVNYQECGVFTAWIAQK
ncbi:class I SAM-dependent methyltransferase [candidate division WWE3 bacterium]|uniref:Class I SAM-dependent methyltransferase n=1 Tax=candidate division WWE3 bacterium TaxID=2053526 RepID=A0A955LJY5_UNCKA|nr:class I SAM-dependent methyltransferase [candidate division WWE3 bacterium]